MEFVFKLACFIYIFVVGVWFECKMYTHSVIRIKSFKEKCFQVEYVVTTCDLKELKLERAVFWKNEKLEILAS